MKFKLNTNDTPWGSKSKKVFISFKCSGAKYSSSVVAFGLFPPAPLINMSQVPKSFNICSLAASQLSFSNTLHLYPFAINPFSTIESAYFLAASSFKSRSATFAPFIDNASANTEQINPPAPVTTTTLSVKSILNGNFILFSSQYFY